MGVTARNNSFGSYLFTDTFHSTGGYTTWDGYTILGDRWFTMETHVCGRGPHTKNPLHNQLGIPNFRNPSGYTRFVWDVTPKPGRGSRDSGGTHYFENAIYPEGAMNDYCPWEFGGRSINYDNWEVANLRNRTRVDMLNKLSDMKANLAESLATAKQTYDLLVGSTTRLVRALLDAKHGRFLDAARQLGLTSSKGISRDILEFQYGWRPLMSDIWGAKELLEDHLLVPIVSAKKTHRLSTTLHPGPGWVGDSNARLMYKVAVIAKLDDNYRHAVQQTGLDNPGLLAWELIPWSFVVDWVLPIGPMIQALNAPTGLIFVSGWELGVLEVEVKSHRPDNYMSLNWDTLPSVEGSGFVMDRRSLSDFPSFSPYIKSPFSTEHGLNLLALFTQLFK